MQGMNFKLGTISRICFLQNYLSYEQIEKKEI